MKENTQASKTTSTPVYLLSGEVRELLRYNSNSAFREFLKATPDFPRPIPLGLRRNAWVAEEVRAYLNGLKEAREVDHA